MRKEVAELLRAGKQEHARIRVEGVIRENLLMQVYALLADSIYSCVTSCVTPLCRHPSLAFLS
jgi:hypothetical protein